MMQDAHMSVLLVDHAVSVASPSSTAVTSPDSFTVNTDSLLLV